MTKEKFDAIEAYLKQELGPNGRFVLLNSVDGRLTATSNMKHDSDIVLFVKGCSRIMERPVSFRFS